MELFSTQVMKLANSGEDSFGTRWRLSSRYCRAGPTHRLRIPSKATVDGLIQFQSASQRASMSKISWHMRRRWTTVACEATKSGRDHGGCTQRKGNVPPALISSKLRRMTVKTSGASMEASWGLRTTGVDWRYLATSLQTSPARQLWWWARYSSELQEK